MADGVAIPEGYTRRDVMGSTAGRPRGPRARHVIEGKRVNVGDLHPSGKDWAVSEDKPNKRGIREGGGEVRWLVRYFERGKAAHMGKEPGCDRPW